MTKEKLEQEAKDYLRVQTQLNGGGLFSCNVKNLLVGFAEPKEKRIEELENKIADIKANCDLAIEGRDIKIKELTDRLEELQEQNSHMFNTIALQEQQIEKMKCCHNCKHPSTPVDNTCRDCEKHSKWELRR